MSTQTQTTSPFETVRKREFGYHTGQVDEFIVTAREAYETESGISADTVQAKTFDLVRGGYRTDQVDQVLARLEDALRRAEREKFIATYGQQAWDLQLLERLEELHGRLQRPAGKSSAPLIQASKATMSLMSKIAWPKSPDTCKTKNTSTSMTFEMPPSAHKKARTATMKPKSMLSCSLSSGC